MESTAVDPPVTSEIADTTTTTTAPAPAAKKTTVLKKFKNVVIAVIRAPGKFIAFAGKPKPPKVVVEDVSSEAVTKEAEDTSVTVEKEREVVAKDAKETEVIAEKVETVEKETEAATVTEKEVPASSDHAAKSSVVA